MSRYRLALLLTRGALARAPSAASAAVTCGYDAVTHRLTVVATDDGDNPAVRRDGDLIAVSSAGLPVVCSGPVATVANTGDIAITDGAPKQNIVTLDLEGGPLAPGYGAEGQFGTPEIEIAVDSPGSTTDVRVLGAAGADAVRIGTSATEARVNLNPGELIGDADVIGTGWDQVSVLPGGGEDVVDASGGGDRRSAEDREPGGPRGQRRRHRRRRHPARDERPQRAVRTPG